MILKDIIMKTKFTFLLVICFFSFVLQGQTLIIEPRNSEENYEGLDLTDGMIDLKKEISITNNTDETIELIWNRDVRGNCPAEWLTQICDNNLCYFYSVFSNVSEEIGLDAPFVLGAGETFEFFALHTLPEMVPGCCRVKVDFSTVQEPDVIIDTAVFDVSVNTPDCDFSTSTKEIEEAQSVSLFPNPTNDQFTLSNNNVVSQVDLYNTLGQLLKSFDFVNGEYMDISDLNSGLYSVVIRNAKGKTLSTLVLDKI